MYSRRLLLWQSKSSAFEATDADGQVHGTSRTPRRCDDIRRVTWCWELPRFHTVSFDLKADDVELVLLFLDETSALRDTLFSERFRFHDFIEATACSAPLPVHLM